jgi:hypothetical protein
MLRAGIMVVTCKSFPTSKDISKRWNDNDPRSTFDSWLENLTSQMYVLVVSLPPCVTDTVDSQNEGSMTDCMASAALTGMYLSSTHSQ